MNTALLTNEQFYIAHAYLHLQKRLDDADENKDWNNLKIEDDARGAAFDDFFIAVKEYGFDPEERTRNGNNYDSAIAKWMREMIPAPQKMNGDVYHEWIKDTMKHNTSTI